MATHLLQVPPTPSGGNVQRAIASMHRVLSSIGWDDPREAPHAAVVVDFGAPHRPVSDAVMAIDPLAQCFMATFSFAAADDDVRDEVMRFATRANWDLLAGNFELDLDGGAVRFRSGVPFAGSELTEGAIRSAIGWAMSVVEAYADPLDDVIAGRADAREALEAVRSRNGGEARHDA
jgi:hypothetical protein